MAQLVLVNRRMARIGLTLVWVFLSCYASGQAIDTLSVLFVGNSYTYFWNLPQTVSAIAESQQQHIVTRQSTAGGVSLKDHWDGNLELQSRELIENGNWDIVILQNHSLSTIDTPDEFFDYGKRFIDLVKKNNAEPVLYLTWARKYNPARQQIITEAYRQLAKDNKVRVVEVGELWKELRTLRPELALFDPDGSHPSPLGTYATACLFYTFLSNNTAQSIPERIITTDKDGEKLYLSIMPLTDAEFIHDVIDRVNQVEVK